MTDSILLRFLGWYFGIVPLSILRTGENFNLWAWHSFSIGFLATKLFSPWHKDISSYGLGFDFERWSKIFLWNLISRFIGAILRICVIIFGLSMEIIIIAMMIVIFILWFALPLIIIFLLFSGLANLKIT